MKFLVFLLLLPVLASGKELTPEEVRQSILANFPLIEEALLKQESAEGEAVAAQGVFDTKLKYKHRTHFGEKYENDYNEASLVKLTPYSGLALTTGYRQGEGLFPVYEGKFDTSSAGEIFAGLSLPLLRDRRVDSGRMEARVALIDKEIAEAEALVKKNLYVYKGLSLYYKWRFAYQKASVLADLLKIAEERQEMLKRRLSAGDVEKIKLVDNERSILKRKEELVEARMDFKRLSLQLGLYYRGDSQRLLDVSSFYPPDKLPDPPTNIEPLNVVRLPQLKILELELEKLKRVNDFYENQKLPSLNLETIAYKELASGGPRGAQRVHVGVMFEYPLENRKAEGKTVSSAYKGLALQKRRQWTENEFVTMFKQTQKLSILALDRVKIISQELENAKILAEAERKRWRRGDSDLYIVALREQDAADVAIKVWKAYFELEQTLLDAKLYSSVLVVD